MYGAGAGGITLLTGEQVIERKKAYNKLIDRHNKAAAYLDNNKIPLEEREKHIPDFQKLLNRLNEAITMFKNNGVSMTSEEILEGFKGV